MPKRMTEKQLVANRRNALKSTGPRTPQGRAVSRMNAMKHGILSRQVLVEGRRYQESGEELEALHRRFWEELDPCGPLEELLVDQIVTAHWRLRRALTAESGEIALSVDSGQRQRRQLIPPELHWMKWLAFGDPVDAMRESSAGNGVLAGWLWDIRKSVEAEGALTQEAVKKLTAWLGGKPNHLTQALDELRQRLETGHPGVDAKTREQQKIEALAWLDRRIEGYRHWEEHYGTEDDHEEQERQAAAVLPRAKVLDKILRYEIKLERQLYRAMAQLERVQRLRRGELVPAPLSVEVSDLD